MKLLLCLIPIFIAGCQSATKVEDDQIKYSTKILAHTPYRNSKMIPNKVLKECNIGTPLSESVKKYSSNYGIKVDRVESIDKTDKGNYIKIEIVGTVSGNRWGPGVGLARRHAKMVTIEAAVFEDGKQVYKINRARKSGGGVFGGFKGTCSVLERTVNTLGNDVAKLLNKYLQRNK